jgi:Icc protein
MPGIFDQRSDRRNFLRTVGGAVLAVSTVQMSFGKRAESSGVRLALISDTHVAADPKSENRKFLPAENLKRIIPEITASGPATVIHNGDVARTTGELADYQAVRTALAGLAQQVPIFFGLGNHDDRENFSKVFSENAQKREKVKDKHVLIIEQAPVRIIMLDSLYYVNKAAGLLGKTQRDWLGQYLKSSDHKPTVIFVHHTLGDADGELLDAERLFETVLPHRQVKAIFYGHSHVYSFARKERLHLVNLPAVGYNFTDKEPVGWVDSLFTKQGVSLTLHAFGGNMKDNGKTTSLSWKS